MNPILVRSSVLSKILIVPWLLELKWFPISVAQLFISTFAAGVGLNLGWSLWSIAPLVYCTFVLTPLVPILPARIMINFGDPIETAHSSIEELNTRVQNHLLA